MTEQEKIEAMAHAIWANEVEEMPNLFACRTPEAFEEVKEVWREQYLRAARAAYWAIHERPENHSRRVQGE